MGNNWSDFKIRKKTLSKFRLVLESEGLKGAEVGAFVRKNGIYLKDLIQWKEQMIEGLNMGKAVQRSTEKIYKDTIRKLERELQEARAVIEIQKKISNLMAKEDLKSRKKSKKRS